MHELAVTQSILDIALSEAEKNKAEKVISIKIAIGEMTGMVPQYIQEYFNVISEDTKADKAKLVFRKIPAIAECSECGASTHLIRFRFRCEKCGSSKIKLVSGKEFYVESLEVDEG